MANDSLSDRSSTVNPSPSHSAQQSLLINLNKARALVAVALNSGLDSCSKAIQHEYLSLLHELLSEAIVTSEKMALKPMES